MASERDGLRGNDVDVQAETLRWLEPQALAFHWDGGPGPIHLTIADDQTALDVHARRAFPRRDPEAFVQLYASGPSGRGESLGMLEHTRELSADARAALGECLRRGYVVPRVTCVVRMQEHAHLAHWELETDRGPVAFDMDRAYDNVKTLPSGTVLLIDMLGNRYEVPAPEALDAQSQRYLDRFR